MLNATNKIVIQKTPSVYLGYASIFSLIVAVVSLFWCLLDYAEIIALIFAVSFCLFLASCVITSILLGRTRYYMNSTINQQYPNNLDCTKTVHDAIIFIYPVGNGESTAGVDNLICAFKARKYPFKMYYCYNPEEFKAILANEKAKYLWIFSHGWRGGITFKWGLTVNDIIHLRFKRQTNLRYFNLIEDEQNTYPPKSFIAQLHCNHIAKKDPSKVTLPEVLMNGNITPEMYHISDNYNNNYSIWFTTRKLVRNLERTPLETSEPVDKE